MAKFKNLHLACAELECNGSKTAQEASWRDIDISSLISATLAVARSCTEVFLKSCELVGDNSHPYKVVAEYFAPRDNKYS